MLADLFAIRAILVLVPCFQKALHLPMSFFVAPHFDMKFVGRVIALLIQILIFHAIYLLTLDGVFADSLICGCLEFLGRFCQSFFGHLFAVRKKRIISEKHDRKIFLQQIKSIFFASSGCSCWSQQQHIQNCC